MECARENFCHFGSCFAFTPSPNNAENQNFEKMKKKTPGDIITLHKCTKNHDHMLYCSCDMVHDGINFYFSFWAIFGYFIFIDPLTAQKIKIFKNEKNTWRYHHFTYVYQKL